MSDRIECVVIGAGVVGLAVARALAQRGIEVLVLEAAATIGTGTSSRNSEVIHAGIYYPKGSAKARFCVEGKQRLYDLCAARGVEHHRCGKLIVAADESQVAALKSIEAAAINNGVTDLAWLTAAQVHDMEPALRCVTALHSPSTGIVDSHGFMLALQGEFEQAGGICAFHSPVQRGRVDVDGIHIEAGTDDMLEITASMVINCAGLHAQAVAKRIAGIPAASIPPAYYAKGNYYVLQGRAPFHRLIYPVPEPGGLGVHLTLDMAGQARFGPDVEWLDAARLHVEEVGHFDYTVDPSRSEKFYAAIRRYWPDLPDGSLAPGYSGIRPKLSGPGAPAEDFLIQGPQTHGVKGLVNLYGIESPGLTSSMAIADYVADLLRT